MQHVGQVDVGAVGRHFARHLPKHYVTPVQHDMDPTPVSLYVAFVRSIPVPGR